MSVECINMTTKQCGNCEFWDKETEWVELCDNKVTNHCKAELPVCIYKSYRDTVKVTGGQDCPIYVERQDAHEGDDDPPDENGYTRADEDWFFDDKDD